MCEHNKRISQFLFNWLGIITMPIWGGLVLWVYLVMDLKGSPQAKQILTGERPLFDFK